MAFPAARRAVLAAADAQRALERPPWPEGGRVRVRIGIHSGRPLRAEGRSNTGIAERMVVTERAVEKHVTSIFQKLGLPQASEDHRRVLAVLTYLR